MRTPRRKPVDLAAGYVMAKAESDIARTAYLSDALPTHNPWLGPAYRTVLGPR